MRISCSTGESMGNRVKTQQVKTLARWGWRDLQGGRVLLLSHDITEEGEFKGGQRPGALTPTTRPGSREL